MRIAPQEILKRMNFKPKVLPSAPYVSVKYL